MNLSKRKEKTMITVVHEPPVQYKVEDWCDELKDFAFYQTICGIENGIVFLRPPSSFTSMIFSSRPKKKLSSLRGKLTKQSKKEIDEQISNLRSEWDRNI